MNTDRNGLPNITDHILELLSEAAQYVVPLVGNELEELRPGAPETDMGARVLTLNRNCVIPFHKNPLKGKAVLCTAGKFTVLVSQDGVLNSTILDNPARPFFIDAGTPHAVAAIGEGENKLLIIASSNVADVVWQEGAVQLAYGSKKKP